MGILSTHLLLLSQVFTRECMSHYLRVFNFLWRAKRMEYILTDIRKGHMCNAKLLRNMPGEPPARARVLTHSQQPPAPTGCGFQQLRGSEGRLTVTAIYFFQMANFLLKSHLFFILMFIYILLKNCLFLRKTV